jgi:enterochelin esterase-like enzyme
MRKVLYISLIMCIILLISPMLRSQPYRTDGNFHQGTVVEGLLMRSAMGNRNVNYAIYLPPDYDRSQRSYPVVYLLHGFSDNETAWIHFGQVNMTADNAIASREIPPMIIVMPDAGVSWYINAADGTNPFENIFLDEFIPFIEHTYRARASREGRAVAGLSMGGYGSLVLALRNPDVFSSVAAFSSAVFTDNEILEMPQDRYSHLFGNIWGPVDENGRLNEHWQNHSVLNLVSAMPIDIARRIRFYIDNGDDDFLFEGNAMLHIAMRKRGIPHQFRVRDGAHNWAYWRNHIIEGLRFIGEGFTR